MKVTKEVLLRVEGEALLELEWDRGTVKDAKIILPSTRGIEKALKDRPVMDALVLVPRVCGICGHAHLMASVTAIEDALIDVPISHKAKVVRNITLMGEIIQNHIKWFYLFVLPDILKFKTIEDFVPFRGKRWIKAVKIASLMGKLIALFGGQWPHSSYAVPGGITSDFKESDVYKAISLCREVKAFFFQEVVGIEEIEFKELVKSRGDPHKVGGDLGLFLELCEEFGLSEMGTSYNRFLTGGEIFPCIEPAHYTGFKKLHYVNMSRIKEVQGEESYSKAYAVLYRDLPYETGPLARQFLSDNKTIRALHKTYRDGYITRISSRVMEIGIMCLELENKLYEVMDIMDDVSCADIGTDIKSFSGTGFSAVEAARGTLIHKICVDRGVIRDYTIITPSQWNLGPRANGSLGVAEKAIIGVDSTTKAQMIVRSFDMCSVCTTH